MSSTQRPQRRLSARLQEKDDPDSQPMRPTTTAPSSTAKLDKSGARNATSKKRKALDYDEDDDGFLFKRVKKKGEVLPVVVESDPAATPPASTTAPQQNGQKRDAEHSAAPDQGRSVARHESAEEEKSDAQPKKSRKRMSFSTPKAKEREPPVRRSKRLSRDNNESNASPAPKPSRKKPSKAENKPGLEPSTSGAENKQKSRSPPAKAPQENLVMVDSKSESEVSSKPKTSSPTRGDQVEKAPPAPTPAQPEEKELQPTKDDDQTHSATKISLPFADTPVIKRNKEMREGKGGKGERRSSLGIRGRRASSLIDTGNSNALPHHEVEIKDFYKHIESESLPEPRRMRQLLTWCATRGLDEKPMGTDFEDASALSAALVIEEELLKDLANKSELSDWFSREDVPVQKKPLPERQNPRNVQNAEKVVELEEQIKKLKAEKAALEILLRPPSIAKLDDIRDKTLLSESDSEILALMDSRVGALDSVCDRVNGMYDAIGPTIDAFADGIHQLDQYRRAAETTAGRVLGVCAERLAQQEKEGRKRALPNVPGSPPRDLTGVLRSLSRADR